MEQPKSIAPSGVTRDGEPRVSVAVPSYNHGRFIEATLRSIMKQTLAPAELIVIDDGSTDNSTSVIERAFKDCPFPSELIARENRGLCATLNEALAKTRGKFFAYLGSDDLWLPEFLAARVALLESRQKAVLAYGHCFLIDEMDQITDCTRDWAPYKDGYVRTMLLQETIAPMSPTVVYRRSALERHGWNERARLEDYELYLKLSSEGDFAFDPQVFSAWRQHASNTSRDFGWMVEARSAAQENVSEALGLTPSDLAHYNVINNFNGAEDLLRRGQKQEAYRFLRKGWRGAPSNAARMRVVAKLLTPYSLVKWRRRSRQAQAARRYGELSI